MSETPDFFANATVRKRAWDETATLDEAIADVRESLSYLVTLRDRRAAVYRRILDELEAADSRLGGEAGKEKP